MKIQIEDLIEISRIKKFDAFIKIITCEALELAIFSFLKDLEERR